jgi:UPF0755 protein
MEDSLVEDLVQNTNHPMVKKVVLLSIFVLVLLVALYHNFFSAPNYDNPKIIMIPRGSSVKSVGDLLYTNKIVRSASVYNSINQFISKDSAVSGAYLFRGDENVFSVANRITSGDFRLPSVKITFPEGITIEEIAIMCEKSLPLCNKGNFLRLAANKEGYLFPDTYLIPKDADATTVVSILKNNFTNKIEEIGLSPEDPKLDEIVILASLIEREALRDDEKPMIASVIYNRLNDGMSLDIDATLQYAKGKNASGKWWSIPTGYDRQIDSPYNTYKNPGTPPSPIANPGIEAIKAAKSPSSSGYYYYIHDPKGNVHFSKTLSEHNQNIERYLN